MFGAFLDESSDATGDGFFVVAAIIGDGWRILKGERLWRQRLSANRLGTFKASHLRKKPEVVSSFAEAIGEAELLACGIIARQSVVKRHLGGSSLDRQYTESPYMHLHHELFVDIAENLRLRSARPVSFVCDENARYLNLLRRSYPALRQLNPKAGGHMGSCTTARDEQCIPLQMADLVASEIRKAGDTWNPETPGLSKPLGRLLQCGVLWKVSRLGDKRMQAVRQLIDTSSRL